MIRKSPKDEHSISKIERFMAIFMSQGVVKSQIYKIFKSHNLTDFFILIFSYVKSIYIYESKQQFRTLKLNTPQFHKSIVKFF